MKINKILTIVIIGCIVLTGCGYQSGNEESASANAKEKAVNPTFEKLVSVDESSKADSVVLSTSVDAISFAQIVNDNSNWDLKLMSEAQFIEGKCSYVDGGDISTMMYEGEVKGYAFTYPRNGDIVYWTQIYVYDEAISVLGIHIYDDISKIDSIMKEYGCEDVTKAKAYGDAGNSYVYANGDVHFTFYMNDDIMTHMLVSVHE